ncbi:peptidylprolyl isomerase [Petroclostridium sp. X23]|uniref:peptidylprolyl isomerase n=1 Tax=Petroclostridium sp. X23 TaxID=3045146 RepID=UPI0024AE3869|nr:peptidylprolyl isomerase [Petroclostridium sp. X23]WHH57607.1 peptidylprolyl isomerase [Petroclostridium sp. X23]
MRVKALARVLSAVLMFSFILSGCGNVDINKEVATINGEKITVREFNFFLWTVKERMQLEAQNANVENFWDTEIEGKKAIDVAKEKALEAAVSNKIQMQKAKEMGITLTDEDSKQITEEKKQYVEGWGGKENYQKLLKEKGMTDKSFTEILEKLKLSEKLYNKVIGEGTEYNISDSEIQAYYDANKQMFYKPQVKAKHILLKTVDKDYQPLPQEKQDEAKKTIDEISTKIKAGEDFDKLMKEFSQDEGLEQYPDGYTFGKGEMVPEFEEAAFSLEPGQVSEVVKSAYGYHIIKLLDKIEAYYSIEETKDYIKENILIPQKYNEQVNKWKEEAKVESNQEIIKKIEFETE